MSGLCRHIRFARCNLDHSLDQIHPDHADEYGRECPYKWENFRECLKVDLIEGPTGGGKSAMRKYFIHIPDQEIEVIASKENVALRKSGEQAKKEITKIS